ncbi:tetraacyldisaccharide 4'-kinase [Hydrogenophaga pseudoflava]|uniref:tetraacyldisaccharide 4'-kinase n=1 Tax=Hydrogenophaga pseudoflava TaxID=47421 RepID=UPI0027E40AA9|nr:tetraacyldisaccharide 4'-kinase [Hydrogenophaga pseudoflava]MDQ7744459.1 tetraacyldisaccharide 4'-kinase [Hydrogenophaga pseudoflava]
MTRPDAEARWQAIWARRGWQACLLWPLSQVYRALVVWRRHRYAQGRWPVEHLPVPVIVVGNVVVGGAGKTPTVMALIAHLRSKGWSPGVVSRGHGRLGDELLELTKHTTASEAGDEPTLIHRRTGVPVVVGKRRVEAARAMLAAHPEVNLLICDDGLQHLALGRDIAIAVFDDRRTGNGWLLPAGLLREPWPPQPGDPFSPQFVLLQRRATRPAAMAPALPAGAVSFVATRRLAGSARNANGDERPLSELACQELVAVAGIARPEVFFEMLRDQGLTLSRCVALPDHASPDAYHAVLASPSATVVCTEKDAVKLFAQAQGLPAGARPSLWTVPLELQLDSDFLEALDRRLEGLRPSTGLSSPDGHQTA